MVCCLVLDLGEAASPSDPTTAWTAVPFPPGIEADFPQDQQTGSAEGDIVGEGELTGIYTRFDPGTGPTNGTIGYRFRVGRDANPAGFKGVALVGIDGDLNGTLDIFTAVDNSGSSDSIRVYPAGNGANDAPSTTTIDSQNPLATFSLTASNYHWAPVDAIIDPAITNSTNPMPTNLDGLAGSGEQTDYFLSFCVPFENIVGGLLSVGVTNVTTNSVVRYVFGTATQPNSLNQDIAGLSGNVGVSTPYTNLDIITPPVTPSGDTNRAPTATATNLTTPEDTALAITLTGEDLDGNAITFELMATPTNGVLSGFDTNTGAATYTPNTNYTGPDSFTFRVHDGTTNSGPALVTIDVTPVNDSPIANGQSVSTTINTPRGVSLTGSDPEGDPLTFILVTGPTNGVVNGFNTNSGALTYAPSTNYTGPDALTFRVNDGLLLSEIATVTISVTLSNSAPLADNQNVTTPEDSSTNLVLTATDPDGTNLMYAILVGPTNGTLGVLDPSAGAVTYTPSTNYVGADSFSFTAFDGSLYSTGLVSITVTPVNDAPAADNQTVSTPEDTSTNLVLTATDPDSTNLVFSILSGPTNGVLSVLNTNTGEVTYTPATNYTGADSFSFRAFDGALYSTGLVSITVTPVNDPPLAVNDLANTAENTQVTIPVLGNDTDPEGDLLTIVSAVTTNGLASVNGTNVVFQPATNFLGTAYVDYTITDGTTNASAVITVTVTPSADVAVLLSGPAGVETGSGLTFTVWVTNLGPSTASNVVVSNLFPTNLTFVGASSGGALSNGVVAWPPLLSLPANTGTNLTLNASAPVEGVFTNIASANSTTPDPDLTNNNGTAPASVVATLVSASQFGIFSGSNVFNPQTGLFEQDVTVTNTGAATVPAFRLYVDGLRPGATLWNATGTTNGLPYVQVNLPLDPTNTFDLILEFYVPDRQPFTNALSAVAVLPEGGPTTTNGSVAVDLVFMDLQNPSNPRFVIEFDSIPGRIYTILYSDDNMATWKAATPSIMAGSNRTQWYDDGPPKTDSEPMSVPTRWYRIILAPENP